MKRLKQAATLLKKKNLDAILLNSEENMHYFCGFSPSEGYILITAAAAYHLVDSRYTVAATRYAHSSLLTVLEVEGSFNNVLKELIQKHQINTLGFEDQRTTVSAYHKLNTELPVTLIPLENSVSALRCRKDKAELALMIKAQRIAESAYTELLNYIEPGKTEKELACLLDYMMLQKGSDGASFSTILVSGVNTSMPHGVPSDKKIGTGEFVTMDFGATYSGYHSDMTRTVAIGSCSEKMEFVYQTVLEAQLAAIDFIAAGKLCRDVYQCAYQIIDRKGFGSYFKHGLGHGVGLEIHEGYSAAPSSNDKYEPGNVTSIEPGIYLPEEFGVRIEDVLYIDENQNINLAAVPKELLIL